MSHFIFLTEEAALKQRAELFVSLWNENKLDEVVDVFTDDGILMPPGTFPLHGKEGMIIVLLAYLIPVYYNLASHYR